MPYYPPASSGGGYSTIQDEGSSLTQRTTMDFVGAGVVVTDTGAKTQVSISGGGAGSTASGTATLDFGVFPGASDASVAVTGQASIVSGSEVWCWVAPVATSDHTADEHIFETLQVYAGNIVAGTGFTIYGKNTNQLNEPLTEYGQGRNHLSTGTAAANTGQGANTHRQSVGGIGTRLFGQWTIGWAWV